MLIGTPKEIKDHEYRAGRAPAAARQLAAAGHKVIVEHHAGASIGLSGGACQQAGARIVETPQEVFAIAETIVKVKEPQPNECRTLRSEQTLFTYPHLASDPEQIRFATGHEFLSADHALAA